MILYLHGFLSSGEGHKAQWYKKAFASLGIEVLVPTYPQSSPEASIAYLKTIIEHEVLLKPTTPTWQIFGSSMGGFYGEYLAELYAVPLVMVNPALDPVPIFEQNIGEYDHPKTGEHIVIDEAYIESLKQYITPSAITTPSRLLLDKGDEVIPYEFAYEKYREVSSSKVLAFEGGDHAFQHLEASWDEVRGFIEDCS
ncbi:YqiA/YcfP family alpha/beta fold hydrolase [Hydrogenovibrio marinus]|uniref:Esterase n=1 Tax=Hydrogenovibrio marinus TaxID=28885 RepID=A0A066ZXZ1_HYDMR|nr:YqiA/YcfP family alpha/beta fold hydrolase [Hydrogenovibrio marinus]KDN95181.1 hypothetical protein EI16_02430 [Hydrogenovibrio marinus]BBN59656.1 esterase YqiA [Hydrogenovibrio marinus]